MKVIPQDADDCRPVALANATEGSSITQRITHVHKLSGWLLFAAIVFLFLVIVLLGYGLAELRSDQLVIANLTRENTRLTTLLNNHTEKLDNDTMIAQGLLTAANSALAQCRK